MSENSDPKRKGALRCPHRKVSGQSTSGTHYRASRTKKQRTQSLAIMAGEGAAPNKFLITQCSIRLITGAKLKIYYSLGNALRGDMSLWTNILSVIVITITKYISPLC